ncbi:succinyl-diaminopimelate desuccinylase [Aerococcus sp. 150760007-1]|uniref:Probable succinyl-diaminopimelate desuccinylase n=1 Tax=Aerococcus urinaeequi TaxID=51665 RepID=A0ABR5ZW92_9LACT|nr:MULTISPECIES: ArgE/DapE family deacylase [Lactobacillales]KAF3298994.1 ArgE/DapE family deacylase [Carnobacterium sp. PL17RED31]KAF3305998.1 ArgE/DapE family deacylase [Carnobacterium sp. PL17GRE32]MBA5746002.1 ArgE/DapE family deacylase [Aerococcus urinaeequi]MBA5828786.1 ArgE/DapE family deacylase [Aerococcus urinaeequi]MBA5859690.1 ArgE/DapE family deacylase [Aerococcus urinaeequi]
MDKQEKIKILQDVIQLETPNGNEEIVALYYKNLLEAHGIESELIQYADGRVNLVAELKGQEDGKILAVSGHMDVVDAGNPDLWTYPPYGAEIHDGVMYGRGTTDMKAGLTALIIAMIELKESGQVFSGTVRLLACVGEEIGMLGSKQLTDLGYTEDIDGMIIAEPSTPYYNTKHKGSIQYQVIAHGRAAHSSTPEKGVNTIQLINDFINKTNVKIDEAATTAENDMLGKMLNVFTMIEGGNQINSVPEYTVLSGNARTIPEVGNDVVVGIFNDVIEDINANGQGMLELNLLQNNQYADGDNDSGLVDLIKVEDPQAENRGLSGATDGSNFTNVDNKFDFVIYGPGRIDSAHTLDESIEVDQYLDFIDKYVNIYKGYLK